MIPKGFQYFAPTSIEDVIALLKKYGSEAKVLAGGMSLIPLMKLRLASPAYVIDINRLSFLEYVNENDGTLQVGALTRHHSIETSQLVKEKAYLMTETASNIGDPQVRNMGTIGGSLMHADPGGDWGAAIMALRAEMVAVGPAGQRTLQSDDFFVDTFTTAIEEGELLTEIRIPNQSLGGSGAYVKFERKVGDFATVGVAVQLRTTSKGVCNYVGIGLTALGATSLRAKKGEAALLGHKTNAERIDAAAEAVTSEIEPMTDPLRGSAEYKKEVARVCVARALNAAVGRIGRERQND